MLGMFCSTNITNNEAYKKHIKRKMGVLAAEMALGLLAIFVALLAKRMEGVQFSEHMQSLYCGIGCGMIAGGAMLLIRNYLLLKDEKMLRQARIASSDERNQQISASATKVAVFTLLVGIYLVIIIGALWYPELSFALSALLILFVLAYVVAYQIISWRH